MTQIHQSYYLGLILQDAHAQAGIDGESTQISVLKSFAHAHRAASESVLSPEERARSLADIAAQFRGDLNRYEWLPPKGSTPA